MTGATTKYALPYPTGTDPISSGDDAIKALAERLDLMLGESGTVNVAIPAADTNVSQRVNYARSYAAIGVPAVMAMEDNTATSAVMVHIWITGEDATGFTVNVRASNTSLRAIRWLCRGSS